MNHRQRQQRAAPTISARHAEPLPTRTKIHRTIAGFLFLAVVAVIVASGMVSLRSWAEKPPSDTPSFAVLANDHAPLFNKESAPSTPFMPADDPSIDLYPNFDSPGHPSLSGLFRVNPIYLPDNDGKAEVGLLLPVKSILSVGSPGPNHSNSAQVTLRRGVTSGLSRGLTCDKSLLKLPGGVLDVRETTSIKSSDYTWDIDCKSFGTLIWVHLPSSTPGTRGNIESGNQHVESGTAAQVGFELPDFPGLTRSRFDSWMFQVAVASGAAIPGERTTTIEHLFGSSASPVVALHTSSVGTVSSAFPSTYDVRNVTFLGQLANIWPVKLSGEVDDFTATITVSRYERWGEILGFLGPLLVGAGVTAVLSWAYRRLRNQSNS
ncbi:hypothetical protein AS850_14510 [Frondihabitans sp. 762G35]|uniref:hypothetical protein n=1 Tax=Frondihabitans sp. 762G35 TaxID=1446794 RepID=UPI000D1FDF22|nr:hypothetical protein [Frondihabitans sp. 762G35]ARC58294.1 hypothetical protein AS850_14510 [Frondihabitans sp. 762G35]